MIKTLGPLDLHLFAEGRHSRIYEKLGARLLSGRDAPGAQFGIWAPNAKRVGVIGDFNNWEDPVWLEPLGGSGIWQGTVPQARFGQAYKYHIQSQATHYAVDKADPCAATSELPPQTASRIWDINYEWQDDAWMAERKARHTLGSPVSIYEMHLGSWMRSGEHGEHFLTYREIAPLLIDHMHKLGFTHVELMPIMEHPFYGSWGYQGSGYMAPTARYGLPEDFMYLVDQLHQAGLGVIVDWVPAHFPTDQHGLIYLDGTHLYEHADPRQGIHPEWGSAVFNYGRNEVRSFLLSSANVWLERYHVDGLRVDAVASMLYLDYGRRGGDWVPNQYGGNENLDAIEFLKFCNAELYAEHPDVLMIAEESTAWPGVSRPVYTGGLGFGMKWDMGWMHDTLEYFSRDPLFRTHHHNQITFRGVYAFTENFVLALSHDEVVHGKGSLLGKMPGDVWQKFANLRCLYALMWSQPGKKLLFMGCEFGQWNEWNHDRSLDWHLLREEGPHGKLQHLVGQLNRLYLEEPSLHQGDAHPGGFAWVDGSDSKNSVLSYLRRGVDTAPILVVINATPVVHEGYRVGVPHDGYWAELLNTDAHEFGGSGQGNAGGVNAEPIPMHGLPFSVCLRIPPLGALYLKTR